MTCNSSGFGSDDLEKSPEIDIFVMILTTETMFDLFMSGGPLGMSIITALLIALLIATWKGSPKVKEIGASAPITALLWVLFESYNAFDTFQQLPTVSSGVVYAGLKSIASILIYGLAVYLLSLIIRFFQNPKK